MQEIVITTPNVRRIQTALKHADGPMVNITIEPGRALVDELGMVRFFSMTYADGEVQGYKLHPHYSRTERGILWAVDFLAGYGLSRAGSALMKPRAGMPSHQAEMVHMGRYFTFSNPGGQTIRSFVSRHFLPEHLGYHNVITDKLIYDDILSLRS